MRKVSKYFLQTFVFALIVNHIHAVDESIFNVDHKNRQQFSGDKKNEKSFLEEIQSYIDQVNITGLTVPGTKWCGPGNSSSSYYDLGSQRNTDMCCREHDYCDTIIEPHTTLHGLNNSDKFPILKCSCEQKFIQCLQRVDSLLSNTLGRLYYGARSTCLDNGYPIISCKKFLESTFGNRCIRYDVDKKKSKIWQFYDMPYYNVNGGTKLQVLHNSPAVLYILLFSSFYYVYY